MIIKSPFKCTYHIESMGTTNSHNITQPPCLSCVNPCKYFILFYVDLWWANILISCENVVRSSCDCKRTLS